MRASAVRRFVALALSAIAISTLSIGTVASPASAAGPAVFGLGLAKFGPVHIFVIDEDTDGIRIDQGHTTGIFVVHGVTYRGAVDFGTLRGHEDFCISTPSCGPGFLDSSVFKLNATPVRLHGRNSDGVIINGTCSGGTAEFGGAFGNSIVTRCSAAIGNGSPAGFDIVLSGVVSNVNNGTVTGTYCVPNLSAFVSEIPALLFHVGCQYDLSSYDPGFFNGP